MASLLLKLFFVAFFINLLYELLHSVLYKTCLEAPLKKYVYLILKAAIFDGFVIALLYYATIILFPSDQLVIFLVTSLLFAYGWEIYSLQKKKWEYSSAMPKIFGVGMTPLIQLTLTGLLSICIVLNFFVK